MHSQPKSVKNAGGFTVNPKVYKTLEDTQSIQKCETLEDAQSTQMCETQADAQPTPEMWKAILVTKSGKTYFMHVTHVIAEISDFHLNSK